MNVKISELAKKLQLGTKEGKLIWETTSRDSEYRLRLGDGSITMDSWASNDGGVICDIAFFNSKGEQVDRYVFEEGISPDYHAVSSLHTTIRRTILRADETIADILKDIDRKLIE